MKPNTVLPVASLTFGVAALGLLLALNWLQLRPAPEPVAEQPAPLAEVQVSNPAAGALVTSPLVVTGIAPGTWFFEASLPVNLLDNTGKVLAAAPAQAQDDWMTTGPVRFSSSLTFTAPSTTTGYLVIKNDNPSGLPEHDKSFRIMVRFK